MERAQRQTETELAELQATLRCSAVSTVLLLHLLHTPYLQSSFIIVLSRFIPSLPLPLQITFLSLLLPTISPFLLPPDLRLLSFLTLTPSLSLPSITPPPFLPSPSLPPPPSLPPSLPPSQRSIQRD